MDQQADFDEEIDEDDQLSLEVFQCFIQLL